MIGATSMAPTFGLLHASSAPIHTQRRSHGTPDTGQVLIEAPAVSHVHGWLGLRRGGGLPHCLSTVGAGL
jgi:hypothetical protein